MEKYRLLGIVLKPRREIPHVEGFRAYLDFVVSEIPEDERDKSSFQEPLAAFHHPDPRLNWVSSARLAESPTSLAREYMEKPLYRRVKGEIHVDLDTHVICQEIGGPRIALARDIKQSKPIQALAKSC
jgi:hypothetical protein